MFASPQMSRLDKSILAPRSIAPGASIFFEPNAPFRFETKDLESFSSFTLAIDYQAIVADTRRSFKSVFNMRVRKEELKEGRFKPSAVNNAEGQFTDQDMATFLGFWTSFAR
jgi:hypothetical protein